MTKKDVLYFALGPVGAALFSLASLPLLAWLSPQEDVGRNNMYVILVTLSMLTTMLGLDQAYGREYYEASDKPSLLKSCTTPIWVATVIFFLIVALYSEGVSLFFFGVAERYYVYVSLACVLLSVAIRFSQTILRMNNQAGCFSVGQSGPKLIFLLALVFSLYSGKDIDFKALVEFHFVSLLGTFIFLAYVTRSYWKDGFRSNIDLNAVKKRLKYGVPLMGGALIFWLLSASSILILRSYAGLAEVAIYSVAMGFAGVAILVQSVLSVIWLPIMYKANAENKYAEVFESALSMVVVLVVAMFFACSSLSWMVRLLLPVGYEMVEIVFVLCMLQPVFYLISEITVVGTNISRKTNFAFYTAIIALAVTLLLSVILAPHFGAVGAAIANAIGFFVFLVARTEFSVIAWGSFERRWLYAMSSAMLLLALLGAILFSYDKSFTPLFWLVCTIVMSYVMREKFSVLIKFIIEFMQGAQKNVN